MSFGESQTIKQAEDQPFIGGDIIALVATELHNLYEELADLLATRESWPTVLETARIHQERYAVGENPNFEALATIRDTIKRSNSKVAEAERRIAQIGARLASHALAA